MLNRSNVTRALMEAIAVTAQVPVGDHDAPTEAGWSQGLSNVDDFTAYAVVSATGGTTQQGSLDPLWWDYRLTYRVSVYAVTRQGVDDLAERVQAAVVVLPMTEVGPDFRTNIVRVETLGPITNDRSVNPHLWTTSIGLSVDVVRTTTATVLSAGSGFTG